MEKSYKFRIYPNKNQRILLQKTFGCVRYVHNYFLARKETAFEAGEKSLTYYKLSKELTELKKGHEWLKEPDKDALQKSIKDLDTAYRNFFSRPEMGFPKFKSKKDNHKSYRTNCNIKFLGNRVQLPKLGKIKVRDKRKL